MKKTICLLTLLFLFCGAVSCTQKPKGEVAIGDVLKTNEETSVLWMMPFPDMAEPCEQSLQIDGKYVYVNIKHNCAYSYLRWNTEDSYRPFRNWFWNYVYRPLDISKGSPAGHNPQYIVIPETTLMDEESRIEPSVVLMNGDKIQAISTQPPDEDFIFSNQVVNSQRILWEHSLSSYTILGLRYYNGYIYYMSREFPYAEPGCERLNMLDASTGELIKQWDLPLDDIPDSYRNRDFKTRFRVRQVQNLYLIYYFPFIGESSPYPIYAFDMNSHTLTWQGNTICGGCSGGFNRNGKVYFLDQEADPASTPKAFNLYGFDIETGERTSSDLILQEDLPEGSPTLVGISQYHFMVAGSEENYFAAIHHKTMNVTWIKSDITGYTQPQEEGTLFLVKGNRWIQKVNAQDGIVLQEWDIQEITRPEVSLTDMYCKGNQVALTDNGVLCAIYKEYVGGYSFKDNHRFSLYLEPFYAYGIVAIDVNKPKIEYPAEVEQGDVP